METLARFLVREPLGVDWPEQLLCQHVVLKRPVPLTQLALADGDGRPVPCQVTNAVLTPDELVRAVDLWFWLDLPAGGEAHFMVHEQAPARCRQARPKLPVLAVAGFQVKLPEGDRYCPSVVAADLPGPLLGFSRDGRRWFGRSELDTRLRCYALTTEVLAGGPLWTEARVSYKFDYGSTYALTIRLYEGRDFAVMDEQMALRIPGRVLLHLYDGMEPDRFFSQVPCPVLANDGHDRVQTIDYAQDDRLREIQVPAIGTYYVPHLAGYGGLFNAAHPERGCIGIAGLDGELWEAAMHNRMRLAVRGGADRDVVLELPARAGRRRWALVLSDVAATVRTRPHEQSRLLEVQIRQSETPLRRVLEMHLAAPAAPTAPLLFTDAVVTRARQRLVNLPAFAQRLAAIRAGTVDDPAFGYLMTGERDDAVKTRDAMLAGLRRFRDLLLRGGGIADCALATISLSRPIRAWAGMLDLIRREPDLLADPEGREIERLLLFWGHQMMGEGMWPHRRTARHQDHPESQKPLYSYPGDVLPDQPYWINCLPNFQSDWLIALAWIGLSYPRHPQARAWIERCLEDLDAQFTHFVFPTGAWIESMNYALYTLNYYCHFFAALHESGVRNYFADERLLRWLGWHTRMLTPPDPRIGGRQTQACIGNAILPDGQAAVFNWYAQQIPDAELAGRLVEVWRREGSPVSGHPASTWIFEALLDPDLPACPLPPTGSTLEPGFGAILRHGEGTPEETFLTFKVGAIFSHYEGDELAFHWHARGVPLCSDYGVYLGPSCGWDAHNVIEVPALDGIRRGFVTDHYLDASADYVVGDHPGLIRFFEDFPESFRDPEAERFSQKYNYLDHEAPLGPKVWIRRALLFVKPHYLVLLDDVDGVTPSRYGIHCVADRVRRVRDGLEFTGRFGLNLHVFVAAPTPFNTILGRHAPARGEVDHSQRFARISGTSGENHYLTVLYPHRPAEKVRFRRLADGVGIEITGPCGQDRVWLARERTECRGRGYEFIGQLAFVRAAGDEREWHLVRGSRLVADGLTLEGAGPVHVRRLASGELAVRADGEARQVVLTDGRERQVASASAGVQVLAAGVSVRLALPPGQHTLTLR